MALLSSQKLANPATSETHGNIVLYGGTDNHLHSARFVGHARELRVALAQFPDFEVVYLFDLAQNGYGYAVNLQVPLFSEWGTAPYELWQHGQGMRHGSTT